MGTYIYVIIYMGMYCIINISLYNMLFKNNENQYENETRGTYNYNYNMNFRKVILSILLSGTIITTFLFFPFNNKTSKSNTTFGEVNLYENIGNETLYKLKSRYPTRAPNHKRRPFGDTNNPTIDFSISPIEIANVTDDFHITPIIVVNGDTND